ncbi:DNA-entry nuclease [Listeria welshimeri]|nr:DNA-entry nuclease [Listeria welshimeri]
MNKKFISIIVVFIIASVSYIYNNVDDFGTIFSNSDKELSSMNYNELSELKYDGKYQEVILNNNKTEFTRAELKNNQKSNQQFSNLDKLNRVGEANAVLGKELMPGKGEKRESLYVDPTGFRNKKTENGWLYNRSHLIGYQLTAENNNIKNLITGTRSLNTPHMLNYENEIASYIKRTGNQVRYRVTPVFFENDLVARGVQLQAKSIQDDKLEFNVYIFNVEKGMDINYSNGSSHVSK